VNTPVVVVGSGISGLAAAWAVSPRPVLVLTAAGMTQQTASTWAQGGIAAALDPTDSVALHAQDTWLAGAGAGDDDTIARITNAAPGVVADLASIGVGFDRRADGSFDLALEGGHHRARVAHVGDSSGAAITETLANHVSNLPGVEVREGTELLRLLVDEQGEINGVEISTANGVEMIETSRVILATGGSGALFSHTTNPLTATGQGVALAARVGARVDDLHLVQFHPTALDVGLDPMPLLTEALRGAGAVLLADGQRFTDELQPRDVVSAAVWEQLRGGRRVVLDARAVPHVATRFPTVGHLVGRAGLSLEEDLLPVRPAVHYSMGGVSVDARSRSTVPGLWAVGEVSRTGLHGGNRLASNSLLEAVVTGRAAGRDAVAANSRVPGQWDVEVAPADPMTCKPLEHQATRDKVILADVRAILGESCGVLRDGNSLYDAVERLADLTDDDHGYVGWMIARSAFLHAQSVGAHRRSDAPDPHTPLLQGVMR
jgi:L-aspartate oxidase